MRFWVPGKPQPAGSKRAFVQGKRALVVDANKESAPWKQAVAWTARAQHAGMLAGPVRVEFEFVRARPKAHLDAHGAVRARCLDAWPVSKPDTLKLARGVEDALTGILYRDDSLIVVELIWKRYARPGEGEGVWITVEEVSGGG